MKGSDEAAGQGKGWWQKGPLSMPNDSQAVLMGTFLGKTENKPFFVNAHVELAGLGTMPKKKGTTGEGNVCSCLGVNLMRCYEGLSEAQPPKQRS